MTFYEAAPSLREPSGRHSTISDIAGDTANTRPINEQPPPQSAANELPPALPLGSKNRISPHPTHETPRPVLSISTFDSDAALAENLVN
ncbi:hypothetical protein RSSM_03512 [Rhodopirellula sallentina SM41]|uniref:Uncharacterized protein n=1 Tax=Rhodopirellula sallentina SM41 TaxID=1263870 RepID=M5U182_9BACT|nr:hypothetical protein RSSM_03512 [Rhodopirellula sallentina SM41]